MGLKIRISCQIGGEKKRLPVRHNKVTAGYAALAKLLLEKNRKVAAFRF
jgi:hypothetical protein